MKTALRNALAMSALIVSAQAMADITFFDREDFHGRSFTTDRAVNDLDRFDFNNRALSAVVRDGRWEVCEDIRFGGRCTVLRPGNYASLADIGMNATITSVREVDRNARIDDSRYAPPPVAAYNGAPGERLFRAPVISAHPVQSAEDQHCWVERAERRCENIPGTARTEYWDVTYNFRGEQYHVQLSSEPGATILVNEFGDPRV